jgi:hypothetical protein
MRSLPRFNRHEANALRRSTKAGPQRLAIALRRHMRYITSSQCRRAAGGGAGTVVHRPQADTRAAAGPRMVL